MSRPKWPALHVLSAHCHARPQLAALHDACACLGCSICASAKICGCRQTMGGMMRSAFQPLSACIGSLSWRRSSTPMSRTAMPSCRRPFRNRTACLAQCSPCSCRRSTSGQSEVEACRVICGHMTIKQGEDTRVAKQMHRVRARAYAGCGAESQADHLLQAGSNQRLSAPHETTAGYGIAVRRFLGTLRSSLARQAAA